MGLESVQLKEVNGFTMMGGTQQSTNRSDQCRCQAIDSARDLPVGVDMLKIRRRRME
jgi:hypothetical protein